jgi:hypothetical protein
VDVDVMCLLFDHPSANAADMMMHKDSDGYTALTLSARFGHVDAMRLLLDHPSADAAAMIAVRTPGGSSALTAAADFAARSHRACACAPLLLLLRRVAAEPQPCDDAQQAHMSKVMERLCTGARSEQLFVDNEPDDARDDSIRLLLSLGANNIVPEMARPVLSRIIREHAQMVRVPHLINEAVVGMAAARKRPRDDA